MIFFLDRFDNSSFGLAVAVREFASVLDRPYLATCQIDTKLMARSNLRPVTVWAALRGRDRNWHMNDMFSLLCIVMTCLGLLTGRRVIICPHGMLDRWALRSGRFVLKRRVLGLINALARVGHLSVHALNRAELRKANLLLSNARRSEIIPNGVPNDIMALARASSNRPCRDGRIVIGSFSRISPKKNQMAMLHLACHLRTNRRKLFDACSFRIDGQVEDQAYMDQIRAAIEENELQDRVTIGGPVAFEDRGALLQEYDIFFFPSKSEGMPYVILEAMSLGVLPVVANTAACRFAEPYGAIIFRDLDEAASALPSDRAALKACAIDRSAFLCDYGNECLRTFLKSYP